MPWVRRTRHLALGVDEDGGSGVVVHSLLTGRRVRLVPDELGEVLGVSDRTWSWRPDGDPWVAQHSEAGVLVTDDSHELLVALRLRDEELTALGWWPDAAALHVGARWEGVRARVPRADGSLPPRAPYVAPALSAFPDRGGPRFALPTSDGDSALHDLLARRRTVRTFDADRPVELGELATLLRWVWGARGTIRLAGGDVGLRRTSPSGGSFHPIEVYPFVRNVEGLAPGIYHYLGAEHALELIDLRAEPAVRELLDEAMAGQWFFAESDVAFVMAARFGRSNRKYRRHPKIYRAVFLDAGHLSQTFYLLCTELGLGPWITAALDESVVERVLGLDPLHEGVVAIVGCGRPRADAPVGPLEPTFTPLVSG
jgi:putative peptide maturation dehydrogenase